jgi:hypothetical protein
LKDEQYRERIAASLFEGIRIYAKSLNGSGKRGGAHNGT